MGAALGKGGSRRASGIARVSRAALPAPGGAGGGRVPEPGVPRPCLVADPVLRDGALLAKPPKVPLLLGLALLFFLKVSQRRSGPTGSATLRLICFYLLTRNLPRIASERPAKDFLLPLLRRILPALPQIFLFPRWVLEIAPGLGQPLCRHSPGGSRGPAVPPAGLCRSSEVGRSTTFRHQSRQFAARFSTGSDCLTFPCPLPPPIRELAGIVTVQGPGRAPLPPSLSFPLSRLPSGAGVSAPRGAVSSRRPSRERGTDGERGMDGERERGEGEREGWRERGREGRMYRERGRERGKDGWGEGGRGREG